MIPSFLVSNFLSYSGNLNRGKKDTPTIALPLAIKKCTVQTGCTVYGVRHQNYGELKKAGNDTSIKVLTILS